MKKKFILLPITLTTLVPITIPLASCNKDPDIKVPTFTIAETTMNNRKDDDIELNWANDDEIEVKNLAFSYGDGTNHVEVNPDPATGEQSLDLTLTFTNDVIDNIVDGVLNFHYKDITTGSEGDTSVRNIKINAIEWVDEAAHIIDNNGVTHLVSSLTESNICCENPEPSTQIICDDGTNYPRSTFNLKLDLNPNLESIENNFLHLCSKFDNPLTLPDSLKSIGNSFLKNCHAFNQSLTLPNGLESVGDAFLRNAHKMTSKINIQTLKVDVFVTSNDMLSTANLQAEMYTEGIEIVGEHKEEFLVKFPRLEITNWYRNLK